MTDITDSTTTEQTAEPVVAESTTTAPIPAANFLDAINEEYKQQSNLKDFKDINDLAKSYIELDRMRGNSLRIPPNDASPEAKEEFYNKLKNIDGVLLKNDEKLLEKLGKPERPEAYTVERLIDPQLLETVPNLKQDISEFKSTAFELGLTNTQVETLVQKRIDALKAITQDSINKKQETTSLLKQTWGTDFDNRLAGVKQVIKVFGEKYGDAVTQLVNSPAGNNPAFLQILSELAVTYKEKNHAGLSTTHFGMTPEMAKQKIADKRADVGFNKAYHDRTHPGHSKAAAEMEHLYKLANGE